MKLNNLSRLTALLLAIIMCMSTLASAEGVDVANLTINKLNEWDMYVDGSAPVFVSPRFDYYGYSSTQTAFGSINDPKLDECTFKWWDAIKEEWIEGNNSRNIQIVHTYESQEFHCVAMDASGNEYNRAIFYVQPADRNNVDAHYNGLTLYYMYSSDDAGYRQQAYNAMTKDWNVAMSDGNNLAVKVWEYWYQQSGVKYLCTCCSDGNGSVTAEIMLAPDAAHKTDCPWYTETVYVPTTLTQELDGGATTISVKGELPAGVALQARTATLEEIAAVAPNLPLYENQPHVALDLSLTKDDAAYQLSDGQSVDVTINSADLQLNPTDSYRVYHIHQDENGVSVETIHGTAATLNTVTFTLSRFSYVIVLNTTYSITGVESFYTATGISNNDQFIAFLLYVKDGSVHALVGTKHSGKDDLDISSVKISDGENITTLSGVTRSDPFTAGSYISVTEDGEVYREYMTNGYVHLIDLNLGSYATLKDKLSDNFFLSVSWKTSGGFNLEDMNMVVVLDYTVDKSVYSVDGTLIPEGSTAIIEGDKVQEIVYKITVVNSGELTLENPTIEDTLPDIFDLSQPVSYSTDGQSTWQTAEAGQNQTFTCDFPGNISGGTSQSIYIKATTKADIPAGNHTNAVKLHATNIPVPGDDTVDVVVPETGTLQIIKNITGINKGQVGSVKVFVNGTEYTLDDSNQWSESLRITENKTYSVSETPKEIPGYILTTTYVVQKNGTASAPTDAAPSIDIGTSDSVIVTITNAYALITNDLTITKTVEGKEGNTTPFTFTVALTFPTDVVLESDYTYSITIAGESKSYGAANKTPTFELMHGQTAVIKGLPNGTRYAVTETSVENYTPMATGETGTIADVVQNVVKFVNTYVPPTGDLILSKTVTGTGAPDSDEFTFTVTLSDTAINGTYGDASFTDGVATVTLKGNESKTITGLPANVGYTVTEAPTAGYTATSTNATGTIVAGDTVTAAFINTYSVADLMIKKIVTTADGVTAPANDVFEITVTLTAAEGAVLADSSYTVTGATAYTYSPATDRKSATLTLTMTGGQTATIAGLQVGTKYTVTETDKDYYKETIVPDGQQTLNANAEVTVTNKYQTGNLTVTKQVAGTFAPKDDTFTFTLTLKDGDTMVTPSITVNNKVITWQDSKYSFTLKNGENITIYGIPVGVTYTVTETENPDYTTTVNNATGNFASAEMTDAGATADFVNTYKYSQLTITKTVSENTPAGFAGQVFDITVSLPAKQEAYTYTSSTREGDTIQSDGKLTIKAGETITIDRVPISTTTSSATYTVTEEEPLYFDVAGEVVTATAVLDSENKVELTNTYKPGSLTITKAVQAADGVTVPTDDEFAFTVTLKDVKGNPISGTFSYYKNDTRDTLSTLALPNESNSLKLKAGESVTFTNLPAGATYTVVEDKHPNYELTAKTGDTGTITETVTTAAFTNTYQYSDLKISKTTVNNSTLYKDDVVTDDVFTFMVNLSSEGNYTYVVTDTATGEAIKDESGNAITGSVASNGTLTLASGQTVTIKNIPVGTTYTVEETAVPEFVTTVAGSNTGTIEAMVVPVVAFTNTYSVGQLTIRKTVVDNSGMGYDLSGDEFDFKVEFKKAGVAYAEAIEYQLNGQDEEEVTPNGEGKVSFKLKDADVIVFHRLPDGVTYTVTETNLPTGYTQTSPADNADVSGTIAANTTSTVAFTNTYNTGSLTIRKTGMTSGETAVFTVTGSVHGKSISIQVAVPNGESTTINGLDIGGQYNVSEMESWTWRYTSSGPATVTIPTDGKYNASVTFENAEKHNYWLDGSDYEDNRFGNTGN